ncbi:hypothetical protein, partial [Sphingomonas adhaesiva]|uniref:hypothetical protein n=1 Tax=Sphingomonas adhaesiva TaxID=28212 RepID=UPI0035C76534
FSEEYAKYLTAGSVKSYVDKTSSFTRSNLVNDSDAKRRLADLDKRAAEGAGAERRRIADRGVILALTLTLPALRASLPLPPGEGRG